MHREQRGTGLEALRLQRKVFDCPTAGYKRALLKTLMNLNPFNKIGEVNAMILKIKEMVKKCNGICSASDGIVITFSLDFPEDMVVCLMIDVFNKDLREHLDLSTMNMQRLEVRNDLLIYVERKSLW